MVCKSDDFSLLRSLINVVIFNPSFIFVAYIVILFLTQLFYLNISKKIIDQERIEIHFDNNRQCFHSPMFCIY